MNSSSATTPTGPSALALPLALAAEMAGRTAPARAQEISAASGPGGHERRAAHRRAMAVRG